ncbi:MAG: hypothetical protein ACE5O2_14575, partial [Armatimonadota bacterium]
MTRSPIGYGAWSQGFEPNRFVRLENIGSTPVVNPWVIVNGKRDWRSMGAILRAIKAGLPKDHTDKELAIAIWEWEKHHRFHATTGDNEVNDPVKVYNVYGYTLCGNDAQVIADMWRFAGFKTRRGRPQGHCTTEVFYDGRWHLLDGDENIICLLRDNETIAEEAEIVRDHDLMKRTHTYGILQPDDPFRDQFSASLCVYEGKDRSGDWSSHIGHTMDMTLRPGEAIEWRWDHVEKAHGIWEGKSLLTGWGETAWARHCNGKWIYAPDLASDYFARDLAKSKNVVQATTSPALRPRSAGELARMVIPMHTPYVIVGGRCVVSGVRANERALLRLRYSFDGEKWSDLWTASQQGRFEHQVSLDEALPMSGPARYHCLLAVEMVAEKQTAEVGLDELRIELDLQMAPLSLPALELGSNRIRYVEESDPPGRVRITHEWVERSASRPPGAVARALNPKDRTSVEGTQVVFQWEPPSDPDGDDIADYHFQLSNRKDMLWPLSPNFNKLISHTKDRGKAQYTLPFVGLLNPEQIYYWRVRAKDSRGCWGPWSSTFSFRCRAPGVPLNVRVEPDDAGGYLLRWDRNPKGRRPARYRVYGSDEKGFSVSDTEYEINWGNQGQSRRKFPSNFAGETRARELRVAGRGVSLPNANKAFYRVVTVDQNGNYSCPSDYAELPRP